MEPVAEAILNVLTIIALIAAIAVIIILLVDLVLSITNKKGSIFFRGRNSDKNEVKIVDNSTEESFDRPQVMESTESNQPVRQTWDEAEAEREQQALLAGQRGMPDTAENEGEKSFASERQDMIERRKQEFDDFDDFDSLFDEEKPAEQVEDEDDDLNFDDLINEINSESVTTYNAAEREAEKEEESTELDNIFADEAEEEVVEEQPTVVEQTAVVEPEITETVEETETSEVVEQAPVIEEEKAEEPKVVMPIVEQPVEIKNVYEYFPEDMLNERLEKLQARLKINERDLRGNRKEYNPLARVKRSLERDQEKLRRKEAIIARKKVLLYGVNNYVDIDEEKAKKLSEDLDLLDGLRLSVQHCEEVMEQNKDRFPILEKTNQILVEQNRNLREDIAEVEAAIARLKKVDNE